jgi:hypothetical protein
MDVKLSIFELPVFVLLVALKFVSSIDVIEVRVSSIEERTAIREAIISGSFSLFFATKASMSAVF